MARVRPGALLGNACPSGTRNHISWTLCSTIIILFSLVYLYPFPRLASACPLPVRRVQGTCVYGRSSGRPSGYWRLKGARHLASNYHHPASYHVLSTSFQEELLEALRQDRRHVIPSLVHRTPSVIMRRMNTNLRSVAESCFVSLYTPVY